MSKVLVLAVHPDDETLGCGGTILKHLSNGDDVYWCIVTSMNQEQSFSPDQIQKRDQEINTVKNLYQFKGVFRLDLPTAALDQLSVSLLIEKIAGVFNECTPSIVYLPFLGDVHSDHRIVFNAAYSCTKSFRYGFIKNIYMMEVLSETDFSPSLPQCTFTPNTFVDITAFIKMKIDIMKIYQGELFQHPFPRSEKNIIALATIRGAQAGCKYAESFMLLKGTW